jgi:glycosyltransferase involved in cell wall biosynthesis
MLYNNLAESRRLFELQQRRGVTLRPWRFEYPNLAIENSDYATILGNEFTKNTFSYANKPMYRMPNAHPFLYPWPQGKNFEACCKNFLWFGSGGLVRKGLDLVLDVFAEMPEYNLTVCGPIQKEKDFEKAYYKELYQTPNIHTVGWVNISSPEFLKITDKCIGLIFPSCAEGQCGAVINCLHAGLIPIISYESGVDVDEFGIILKDCSIHTIKNTVRMVSDLPADKLRKKAKKAWEYARANHTREKFAEEYRKVIEKIKNNRSQPQQEGIPSAANP